MTSTALSVEHKVLALDAARLAKHRAEPGSFEGFASHFGNVDAYGDIVRHGAYKLTLPEFLKSGMILWSHDLSTLPIATPTVARETDGGLWLEADFHTTRAAQDARTIIRERAARGKGVGLSIGYVADDFEFRDDGVRVLKSVTLVEVSVTCLPANPRAVVVSAKSGQPEIAGHHERRRAWIDSMIVLTKTAHLLGVPAPTWRENKPVSAADGVLLEAEVLLSRSAELVRGKH